MTQGAWSIKAPASSLKQGEAVLMLRLGAAVNALRSAHSWFLVVKDTPGPGGSRDRIAAFLVAAAWLKEAMDGLLCPNYKRITELATREGISNEQLQPLGNLMSRKRGSLYESVLKHTRNKITFHWDEKTFRRWGEEYSAAHVIWARGSGVTSQDAVHWASSDAIVASIIPGANADQVAERLKEVAEGSALVAEVFEAAVIAYVRQQGGTGEHQS